MSNHIDFYFDIISPYAYIAHNKILRNRNVIFNYKPIYLGGLHKLAGIDSPVFNEYKLRNNINDCNLVSQKNNIKFKWNSNFPINSLNLMRGYISVSQDKQNDYLNCFFDAYWKYDYDLSNYENISKLLEDLKIDNNFFFQSIKKQSIKDKLIQLTTEAFEKKVFGAPTFIVNNKVFWGQDRLEYALEELNN
ncbi:DsbA family protein [Candidatus Pelagibacter sp.]|nr:DsbA family protein [Candidatus Pelagibacter sp.]